MQSPIGAMRMSQSHINNFKDLPEFQYGASGVYSDAEFPPHVNRSGNFYYWKWVAKQ